MLFLLGVLGACGRDPAPPPTGKPAANADAVLAWCARYADLPDVRGFCLVEQIQELPRLEDVELVCPKAGDWEPPCRHAWVSEQGRRNVPWSGEQLLRACGNSEDCVFQILDTHGNPDVVGAVRSCEERVPKYLQDCTSHALHRWVVERRPDDAEAARVLSALPAHLDLVAEQMGMADACLGSLRCPTDGRRASTVCRSSRDRYRGQPQTCPR
jgi:hypothetical protein